MKRFISDTTFSSTFAQENTHKDIKIGQKTYVQLSSSLEKKILAEISQAAKENFSPVALALVEQIFTTERKSMTASLLDCANNVTHVTELPDVALYCGLSGENTIFCVWKSTNT